MGMIFNPAVGEATGSLYKLHTQRDRTHTIPTNSGAHWAGSQLIGGDKPMSIGGSVRHERERALPGVLLP